MSNPSIPQPPVFFSTLVPSSAFSLPPKKRPLETTPSTQPPSLKRPATPTMLEGSLPEKRKRPLPPGDTFVSTIPPHRPRPLDDSDSEVSDVELSDDSTPDTESPISTTLFSPIRNLFISPKPDIYQRLFGSKLKEVHFEQGRIGDCYLVAAFDAICRHRNGEKILRRIKIEQIPGVESDHKLYVVKFPTGRHIVINAKEVGLERRGRKPLDGPKGLQILELAYAKMTRCERNRQLDNPHSNNGRGYSPILVEGGTPQNALYDMLGGTKVKLHAKHKKPFGTLINNTDPLSKNPDGLKNLEAFLSEIAADSTHDYLLGASTPNDLPEGTENNGVIFVTRSKSNKSNTKTRFYREHVYSVRGFNLAKKTITVANPHDTAKKVYTLTLPEFCNVFQSIGGIKLDREPTL